MRSYLHEAGRRDSPWRQKGGEQPQARGWRGAHGPGVSFWGWWSHSSVCMLISTYQYTSECWILKHVTYSQQRGSQEIVCAIPRARNEQAQSHTHGCPKGTDPCNRWGRDVTAVLCRGPQCPSYQRPYLVRLALPGGELTPHQGHPVTEAL